VKLGGGAAGHNGLRSLDAEIGDGYRRVRIGVGHPGVKDAVPHYVLHDFPKGDAEWLVPLIDAIGDNAPLLAEGKDATFANRLHALTDPEKKAKAGAAEKPAPTKGNAEPVAKPPEAKAEGPLARNLKKLFGL
jgi:PTH1 family peptidyl-tRNA hydrolase